MIEKVYRYEFESGCKNPHTGILAGLDEIFKDDRDTLLLLRLCWFFEDKLYAPDIPSNIETISYFTRHGNRAFHKAIKEIKNVTKAKYGIDVIRIERDLDLETVKIIYQDKHQIIIKRED